MPRQSVRTDWTSFMVRGSRKSNRSRRSATTIAYRPSGVKYMLYGSSTWMSAPSLPVSGSIGVRVFELLLRTQRVERSYDGTTCSGTAPVLKVRTIVYVAGSITVTDAEREFGT